MKEEGKKDVKAPKEVKLTEKQKKALLDNAEVVAQAEQQYNMLAAKQQEALTLVLDAHGFDAEKVANVEIKDEMLLIHEQ